MLSYIKYLLEYKSMRAKVSYDLEWGPITFQKLILPEQVKLLGPITYYKIMKERQRWVQVAKNKKGNRSDCSIHKFKHKSSPFHITPSKTNYYNPNI